MIGKIIGYTILGLLGAGLFYMPFWDARQKGEPWWFGLIVWGVIATVIGLLALGFHLIGL